MMHARLRSRRSALLFGAAALSFGLITTTMASPASAEVASSSISSAINTKHNAIRTGNPTLYNAAFRNVNDPDGDLLPNMTPDRVGGFMYWTGSGGSGAIYSHRRSGSTTIITGAIYGNILLAWASRGYEVGANGGAGYPVEDEHNPTLADRAICPAAVRVQRFMRREDGVTRRACFMPNAGTPFQVAWTG
jgi:hypothetical protein